MDRSWWKVGFAVATVVPGVAAWLVLQSDSDGLPGPLGGSHIAQDVNTLVGAPAPDFTLSNSDGQSSKVTPGQGRPLVLVFHMGVT